MTDSSIEEIKNRLDIVDVIRSYIKLQKAGVNYRAICPFHSEKKPSFFVSPTRQIWHCFGACGEGGDMFKFVMKIEGVDFGDALRILAQKAGVELKREDPKVRTERKKLYDVSELACSFFEKQLQESSKGKEAKKYLQDRGIKEESIKEWRLGYAPETWQGLSDFLVGKGFKREEVIKAGLCLKSEKSGDFYDRFRGRIIFPIFDLSSQVVGFGGRVFEDKKRPDGQEEAKYINSPGTLLYDKSKILYGLNKAGVNIRKNDSCILVEGYTDTIMAHQTGFNNVVATSGTALTPFQLKVLKRYSNNLFTAFDMDIAGNSATKRGIDLAQERGFDVKIIMMPQDLDPADLILQSSDKWKELIKKAKSIHDFYFETTFSKFDESTLEGKKSISKVLLPIIKRIPNIIEKSVWIKDLAEGLEVKEEDVLEEFQKTKIEEIERKEDDFVEKKIPIQKTRKQLLEEHLASLVIKKPENLKMISEEDLQLFSPYVSQIFSHFKKEGFNIKGNFPGELGELVDFLCLKAEDGFSFEEDDNPDERIKEECKSCLKELKTLLIRDKLTEISRKIKKAEKEENYEEVQKLLEQFDRFSKSWNDLEIA